MPVEKIVKENNEKEDVFDLFKCSEAEEEEALCEGWTKTLSSVT